MKTSCIIFPASDQLIVIRNCYQKIASSLSPKDINCTAAILWLFEEGHNFLLERVHEKIYNRPLFKPTIEDYSQDWVFCLNVMMCNFKEEKVCRSKKLLLKAGLISENQYGIVFNVDAVQKLINSNI